MQHRNKCYVLNTKRYVWSKSNNTSLSTTHHIFKHGGGCTLLWVCLPSASTREFLGKKKQNRAKHRQNHREKPASVYFPTDTGRQIHLSAGKQLKTQCFVFRIKKYISLPHVLQYSLSALLQKEYMFWNIFYSVQAPYFLSLIQVKIVE